MIPEKVGSVEGRLWAVSMELGFATEGLLLWKWFCLGLLEAV